MGCDGGTIPRRDELVTVKKKPEAKDKDSELSFQWQHCRITQQPLEAPVVACGLGYLYNKVSLIMALLSREPLPISYKHVKSLKDVKILKLTPNPEYKPEEDTKGGAVGGHAPYICPVVRIEMSGKYRFVALWSCGCVFSERALKEIPSKNCHNCQKPFTDEDVVVLNGTEDDLVLMKSNMEARKDKTKKPKVKKESEVPAAASSTSTVEETASSTPAVVPKADKKPPTVKVENPAPKRNLEMKDIKNNPKKAKHYSVAKDPSASDVYKSLFTTHKSEKEQERAHWITYNPFYN